MSLIKGKTKWILFLSSSSDCEDRHVWDLAFGLQCLEIAGIKESDVFIYVDGKNKRHIHQIFSSATEKHYEIKESKDFFSDQESNNHENMVMFVTGHGSIHGIDAPTPVTPYMLLDRIKSSPNLQNAIIFLGQCHAGIFNYIPAGKARGSFSKNEPDVILIGATNLHNSLSAPTQETFSNGPINWVANLFLLHVFKWISNPIDVDGDGRKTIMDSYKYAGVMSNDANKEIKMFSFILSMDLHDEWISARDAASSDPSNIAAQVKLAAIQTKYETILDARYTHQECWILNSIPAQQIEI